MVENVENKSDVANVSPAAPETNNATKANDAKPQAERGTVQLQDRREMTKEQLETENDKQAQRILEVEYQLKLAQEKLAKAEEKLQKLA